MNEKANKHIRSNERTGASIRKQIKYAKRKHIKQKYCTFVKDKKFIIWFI